MEHSRRTLIRIWIVTAAVVAVAGWFAYQQLVRIAVLEGRGDMDQVFEDPTVLFSDPGVLGSSVERRAYEAVQQCMAAQGFNYRSPVAAESLDGLRDAQTGYGIAAGDTPADHVAFREDSLTGAEREAYEAALFGGGLDDSSSSRGCAARGAAILSSGSATLAALPYSIEDLQRAGLNHPAYREAQREWSACMKDRGYDYRTPDAIISDLTARLAAAGGDQARELAEEEREIAVADFDCRSRTLDAVIEEISTDLAPEFLEANRVELATLLPPGEVDLPGNLGTGDVQVTLRWEGDSDLDLEVTDPLGNRTSYRSGESVSASGGTLDVDANYPCGDVSADPIENVFWATDTAPSGTYQVEIVHRGCNTAAASFELIVQVRGRVVDRQFGSIENDGQFTTEFNG